MQDGGVYDSAGPVPRQLHHLRLQPLREGRRGQPAYGAAPGRRIRIRLKRKKKEIR